jgi:hypothetical protein
MATTMTLLELRTATRQRADMVNSQFVSDSELNSYINQSYFELYDILIQKYGDDYYVASPYSFITDGASQFYTLPTDFYKLLGVDLALSNTLDSYVTIRPFNFGDRNRYAIPNFQSFYGVTNLRYRLKANDLWLTPIPGQGQTIRIWYVPRLTTLATDVSTADGISGWTEYIIIDAAIKCLQKEESDVSILMAQKQAMIERIKNAAENRDAAFPSTVVDSQYTDFWWPTGSGSGNGSGSF